VPTVIIFFLVFAAALFRSDISKAQKKYLARNYWVENYGKSEGLPQDIVDDITQDRSGYIWLTTPYDLVRFDGYEFKTYSPRDQFPDLYFQFESGLLEDSRGLLWMATEDAGALSFDPRTEKFTRYYRGDHDRDISGNFVTGVEEDSNGNIWLGTNSGLNGIFFKEGKVTIKQYTRRLTGRLLNHFNRIIDHEKPLVSLIRVGNSQSMKQVIELSDTSRYLIISMGEANVFPRVMNDYGWIEDDHGRVIWKQEQTKDFDAGGDARNMLQLDIIRLPPGKYKVAYQTNAAHAWNSWNLSPPDRPNLWGIQLFQLNPSFTDTMSELIKNELDVQSLVNDEVLSMAKDSGNVIWILTPAGLERLNPSSYSQEKLSIVNISLDSILNFGINAIKAGSSQLLITGIKFDSVRKENGLGWVFYDYVKGTFRTISLRDSTNKNLFASMYHSLAKDGRGIIWYGTFNEGGNGLYTAEEGNETSTFKRLDLAPPESQVSGKPSFDQIWSVYKDHTGYIWVGSRQFGLFKIKLEPSPIKILPLPGDVKTELGTLKICEDVHGNVLINEKGKHLLLYNVVDKQFRNLPLKANDSVKNIFYDPTANAFVCVLKKQIRTFDLKLSVLKTSTLFVPDSLLLFGKDSFGNFWAVDPKAGANYTPNKNYLFFDGTQFRFVPFDSSGNFDGRFRNIYFGHDGYIWLAPAFEGLHLYRWDNKLKKAIFIRKFLPGRYDVFSICEDARGFIWLGTYDNGVVRLDPATGKFQSWTRKDGMPSNFVQKVVPSVNTILVLTDLGSAFINTNSGAIRISKDLDEYVTPHKRDEYFDKGWGYAALVASSGEFAVATNSGLCLFKASDISPDSSKPILHITYLKNGNGVISFRESMNNMLTFSHDQNDLEIDYVGVHYDRPSLNQYAYFLKGADGNWVSAGTGRVARYSHLLPGHYEFYLKSANASGIWSDPQKMIAFEIRPPWWQTWWAYALYVLVLLTTIWSFVRYRSIQLKRENILLEEKVNLRTSQLKQSMDNLKATQSQLIQSEKMASLGELTSGIAHEIQNPLNFVNNFSEINKEMLEELKTERLKPNVERDEKLQDEIINSLINNEEKIVNHGKRADAIVKGMLQHSRTTTGQKALTNINALADEYLRMSYHAYKVKNRDFHIEMNCNFESNLQKITVIPQDIGRVLLNIYNNAFYEVSEKMKSATAGYEPNISVSTKKLNDKIVLTVMDNGNGIPQKIVDKIFQPFFTTKPTGQGTGLGLSLSYDIVKAHGGEIKVNTIEGEYTEFLIHLPINL